MNAHYLLNGVQLPSAKGATQQAHNAYGNTTETFGVTVANVVNSPLTLENVLLRGFHLREGSWFFHGGYTSQSMFQNVLLPTQQDTVIGAGYRYRLGENASLTPNVYYINSSSSPATNGHSGTVVSLAYRYQLKDRLTLLSETGWGGGMGAAGRLEFQRKEHEHIYANLRYEPVSFASVAVNNLHGFLSDFRWERKLGADSSVAFSGNQYDYAQSAPQVNISSNWSVNRQVAKHWSASSGLEYSRYSGIGNSGSLQNAQIPVGGVFTSSHFGAGAMYRASVSQSQGQLGNGIQGNMTVSVRVWHLSTYFERQTDVPTVASLVSSVPGLQDMLTRLGIAATTPQQISDLLSNEAVLQALGLVNGLSLNLSLVLLQLAVTLNWSGRGASRQQLYLSFLYNSNEMPSSTQQSAIYAATYSRQLTDSNTIFASYSLFRSKSPGVASSYQPLAEFSLRHRFNSAPPFLMPGRKGTISGVVFQDLQLKGMFHADMPPMAGVEVVLDGTRRTTTDAAGRYSFSRVPFGSHRLRVAFRTERPFYYTTQSDVTAEIDTAVNFGIAFSRARLIGHVLNDAGSPVLGVKVEVTGAERTYSAQTDAGGTFTIADLAAGAFRAEINPESLPIGYVSQGLESVAGELPVGAPKHITFEVKAIRAVAGKVNIFDSEQKREVPVPGVKVRVVETGAESTTDREGNYLLRQMPAGTFTLAISYQGKDFKLSVSLPSTPTFRRGNDFSLGRR